VGFFSPPVLEIAVVHELADRRLGKRADFHQIDLGFLAISAPCAIGTMPTSSPLAPIKRTQGR